MAPVLERRAPAKLKQNDWLIKHGYNVTSQGGEDGVIAKVFGVLATQEAQPERRWCVEFGAWDGKHLSNTWELLHNQPSQWSGVLIEADASRVEQMKTMYQEHANVTCVNSFVELDGENRLASILTRANADLPKDFDLISIDVDGADYHIWAEFDEYTPKVVIIEFNPTIPNNVVYIQERSTNIYHGSSLAALIALGKKKGYELVSTTTFNAVFVQERFYPLFKIEDNSIDKMHDVPMPTEFFQLYDGTIKITGCKKLIWKNIPIHDRDLQILPASARAFPYLPSEHDVQTVAAERFKALQDEGKEEFDFFITLARANLDKYHGEEIRKVLRYATQICQQGETRDLAIDAVWSACEELYRLELNRNNYSAGVFWLEEMLQVKPRCLPTERAMVLCNLGECLVRDRQFEKAEFYLQTSLAIGPNVRETLKALAKLYTKTKQPDLVEGLVERIRAL
ncbi:hypothetical protein Poli38472_002935 [Pythium oligandrum]|uniref:Methyltransferase FkbM domain-containing protein n=1 Tax=Pythium oligandrum TaxID=41045 RepID=A0A8K1C5V8_PYTOL|nr:hypothetical protein Poli38472_002935 [Pythium oligandrum]|eukprot:TMW57010.1 hypothetical protein Poli38472_002935 [Pythium oligandrum]